jgi:hypothetical protein
MAPVCEWQRPSRILIYLLTPVTVSVLSTKGTYLAVAENREGAAALLGDVIAEIDRDVAAGREPDFLGAWLKACFGDGSVNLPDHTGTLNAVGETGNAFLGVGQDHFRVFGSKHPGLDEVVDQCDGDCPASNTDIGGFSHD